MSHMWKSAARAAVESGDPWAEYGMGTLPIEKVLVHRFTGDAKALRGAEGEIDESFTAKDYRVRMQSEPFARGAQRECFRMNMLAPEDGGDDVDHHLWRSQATNYVAKRYMLTEGGSAFVDGSDRASLIGDVRLQSAAEVWAHSFNVDCDPPKKVDMLSAFLVEFVERDGAPIFCVEAHMAGEYVKYNTNAGFVEGIDWSNDFDPGSIALMHVSAASAGSSWLPVRILRQRSDGTYDVQSFPERAAPSPFAKCSSLADGASASAAREKKARAALRERFLVAVMRLMRAVAGLSEDGTAALAASALGGGAEEIKKVRGAVGAAALRDAVSAVVAEESTHGASVWKLRSCCVGEPAGADAAVLFFPTNLHAGERRCVHVAAEQMGLAHASFGTANERRVVVSRSEAMDAVVAACEAENDSAAEDRATPALRPFAPLTQGSWSVPCAADAVEEDLRRLGLLHHSVPRTQLKKGGKCVGGAGAPSATRSRGGGASSAGAPPQLLPQMSTVEQPIPVAHPRATPQAFSMYSWLASAGRVMVVDVQGVGGEYSRSVLLVIIWPPLSPTQPRSTAAPHAADLYTDPQLHSLATAFGNSDLGVRGMALFHSSHEHSALEHALGLTKFPLYKDFSHDAGDCFLRCVVREGFSLRASAQDKVARTPDLRSGTLARAVRRKQLTATRATGGSTRAESGVAQQRRRGKHRVQTTVAAAHPPVPALWRMQTAVPGAVSRSPSSAPRLVGLDNAGAEAVVALRASTAAVHFALAQLHQEAMLESDVPDAHRRNPHIGADPNAVYFHASLAAGAFAPLPSPRALPPSSAASCSVRASCAATTRGVLTTSTVRTVSPSPNEQQCSGRQCSSGTRTDSRSAGIRIRAAARSRQRRRHCGAEREGRGGRRHGAGADKRANAQLCADDRGVERRRR